MTTVDVESISKYLVDYNYIVRVFKRDEYVIVTLPDRLIDPIFESTECSFRFTDDGFVIDEEEVVVCPEYARRLGVECVLIMMCNCWKYPVSLVYVGDKNEDNILDILDIKLSDEDAEKEAILLDVITQYDDITFEELISLAKKGGVDDAFTALREIFYDLWLSSNLRSLDKENEDDE